MRKKTQMQNFSVAKEESISKVFPEETADPSKKVSITYEGPIHVNPSEAIFSNLEVGKSYEMTVKVKNTTKRMLRIKIKEPETTYFRCDYENKGPLAPGLSLTLTIIFETDMEGTTFPDKIIITPEGEEEFTLKLLAKMKTWQIVYPPFVNFKFMVPNETKEQQIKFENQGDVTAAVAVAPAAGETNLRVLGETGFEIKSKSVHNVLVQLTAPDATEFLTKFLNVTVGGELQEHISINAAIVKKVLSVVFENGGGQASEINFGSMFYGEIRECNALLVNNGPSIVNFNIEFSNEKKAEGEPGTEGRDECKAPRDIGLEMMEREMNADPVSGIVQPYSEIPIKFTCKTKKSPKFHILEDFKRDEEIKDLDAGIDKTATEYHFTARLKDGDEVHPITMRAKAAVPPVVLSKRIIQFYELSVNESDERELIIYNKSEELPVTFNFPKIAHFKAEPCSGIIAPLLSIPIRITFKPNNLGVFSSSLNLDLVNGIYSVPIKLFGIARKIAKKQLPFHAPVTVKDGAWDQKKEGKEEKSTKMKTSMKKAGEMSTPAWMESSTWQMSSAMKVDMPENKEWLDKRRKQEEYNQYIANKRSEREKDNLRKIKMKLQAKEMPKTLEEYLNDVDLNLEEGRPPSPKLNLTLTNDTLWVTKKIGKHEPSRVLSITPHVFDAHRQLRKQEYSKKAKGQEQKAHCKEELTPEELLKISAGPIDIDFGELFVNSEEIRYFSVVNDLDKYIKIKFKPVSDLKITPNKQVIPGGGAVASFSLSFKSSTQAQFTKEVWYSINKKRDCKIKVHAKVEPVKLDIYPYDNRLSFAFKNDQLVRSLENEITISNPGNWPAKYSVSIDQKGSSFSVNTGNDLPIEKKETKKLKVSYTPSEDPTSEKAVITIKVSDGNPTDIVCEGNCPKGDCEVVGGLEVLDFGEVQVGGIETEVKSIQIKNKQTRESAVVEIDTRRIPELKLKSDSNIFQIHSNSPLSLDFTISCFEQKQIEDLIMVYVRGGKTREITVKANVIIPDVVIKETVFDFGVVSAQGTKETPLTFVNNSNITAFLFMDLEKEPELDIIRPIGQDERVGVFEREKVEKKEDKEEEFDNEDESENSDNQAIEEIDLPKRYTIGVKPKSTFELVLKFTPNVTESSEKRQLDLPVEIKGGGKPDGIKRAVNVEMIRPKITIDPDKPIQFDDQVVRGKNYHTPKEITLMNMELNDPLPWAIKKDEVEKEGIWTIVPYDGILEKGGSTVLRASFNPQAPGEYTKKVKLYIDNDLSTPYQEFELRGRGTTPTLIYNQKEIVVPPVPLNTESKMMFRVINQGYENLDLSNAKIVFQEYTPDNNPVRIEYPEKTKAVNVSKKDLKLEAVFLSKKPINMTASITFQTDNPNPPGPIDVSAVADNCILTNYTYILRNKNEVKIVPQNGTYMLQNLPQDSDDENTSSPGDKLKNTAKGPSKAESTISRLSKKAISMIGYEPIPTVERKKACDYIKRWLNANALQTPINSFPQAVINDRGEQLLETIKYLSKKNLLQAQQLSTGAVQGVPTSVREDDSLIGARKRFEIILTELTKYGAMLNTIRPEHLLSREEYKRYIKDYKNLKGDADARFEYLSEEAWITLFYQIIKIFYLRRVTVASWRSIAHIPSSEKQWPPGATSNVYSEHEIILLKWLQYHYNLLNQFQQRQLTNFDADLQDGQVFAAVIKHYFPSVKGLQLLKIPASSQEDFKLNATKIINTLKGEIQLRTHIVEDDIVNPSAREMIVFCTQLYLYLPNYVPIEPPIEFPCTLGEKATKQVELKNENDIKINYNVQIEGSSDFTVEKTRIAIDPGKIEILPVSFSSRISKPVTATLMLISSSDGPKQAAPLVFKLISKVLKRTTFETKVIEEPVPLYEYREVPITITNTFSKTAKFTIQLICEKPGANEGGNAPKKKNKPDKRAQKAEADEMQKYIPDPYYCRTDSITVNKGSPQTLTVIFMPFEMGTHKCIIGLIDQEVGELQYEIIANSTFPSSYSDPIKKVFPAETRKTIEIPVSYMNSKMVSARTQLIAQCSKDRKDKEKAAWEKYKLLLQEQQLFKVTISSKSTGVFSGPDSVILNSGKKDMMASKGEMSQANPSDMRSDKGEDSKLVVSFQAKSVNKYEATVILSNTSKTDIRIFDIGVLAHPPTVYGKLEFNVPARQKVTQEIPINNESERDWNVKAELKFENKGMGKFEINKAEFVAPKKTTTYLELRFIPEWLFEAKNQLTIHIANTNQEFIYELVGKGEEPLAEDPKVEVICEAKKTTKYQLMVKNESDKFLIYRVETDMPKVLWGDKELKIAPKSTEKYTLNITPVVGGRELGTITFFDQDERYIWYVVELIVRSPEVEEEKVLQANVREPIALDFAIRNPLNEPVTFEVDIKGDGLLGDQLFAIPANQTKTYELIFAPLKAMKEQGYINFVSEKAGELKYKLSLLAEESPVKSLELMTCELGKTISSHAYLENPTKDEQVVVCHNSNPTNFDVLEKIQIPPYKTADVLIKYTPSNLDTRETARLVFESKSIGKWEFYVEGIGKLPTDMKPEIITTTVGDTIPSSITFKNPFKEPTVIEIALEPPDHHEFTLMLKKSKVTLGPLATYSIPYNFTPHSMAQSEAFIVVTMTKQLVWRFPLVGNAEHRAHGPPITIKCQARGRFKEQEPLKLTLPDLAEIKKDESFSIKIVPKDPTLVALVDRSVMVLLKNTTITKTDEPLEVEFKFEPLRPFKAQTELIIAKSGGGRWRFDAIFESTDPDPDDTIEIKSPLHKTSSVSFRLCNHTRAYADFQAYFTHDSATEFSVYPKSGVLEPFGKDGTNFIVSFTPTEYGKNKIGKLIIVTEEMQWSYVVKGSHPEYKIPKPGGGRLDNKLTKDLEAKITHKSPTGKPKNFIKENIKKQKELEMKVGADKKKKGEVDSKSKEMSPGAKSAIGFGVSKSSLKG